MGCAISPSGFPQIFSVKNRFFLYAAPAERGTRTATGVFALTGRLLSLHRLTGVREPRRRVRPGGAAPFSAPAERGTRTALACSPLTGGEFFA